MIWKSRPKDHQPVGEHTAIAKDHAAPEMWMWRAKLLMCTRQEAFPLGLRMCFRRKKS